MATMTQEQIEAARFRCDEVNDSARRCKANDNSIELWFACYARTDLPAALDHIAEQQAVIHWLATVLANMECGIPLSEQIPELTEGMSPPCPEEIIKVVEESVASASRKETPAHAFVDRRCPSCDGHGCDACQGGGLVGSYDPVPDIHLPDPSPWADAVRRFRERSGMSIRAMGERVGLTPSQWSEIERGLSSPTDEQRASIDAMMHN